jgi:pimeloyl-ACP methyl ester carboxylesterase
MELKVQNHRWLVNKLGRGDDFLVAFHGYGQDSSWFENIEELLGDKYTILAIDLAYHGTQADLPKSIVFDKGYALEWLTEIKALNNNSKLGFIGYSIGARVALSIASWFPETISEIYLFAPDGMPVSRTYKLLTGTWLGAKLFRGFIKKPGFAFGLIGLGKTTKILPKKVAEFFRNEISTSNKRQQLFDTWMTYRKALPNYSILAKRIKDKHLPITCILGKQDRVIPLKTTRSFAMKSLPGIELIELELGHNLLSDKGMRLLNEYWQ